jgi:hypothetical protein
MFGLPIINKKSPGPVLVPVLPATWMVEIGRILVQRPAWVKVSKTPISKKNK